MAGAGGALPGMDVTVDIDKNRLARRDIADQFAAKRIKSHALGGDDVLHAVLGRAPAIS